MPTEPETETVTVYLDEDVLAWLKKDDGDYQTRANQLLREHVCWLSWVGVISFGGFG